MAIKIFGKSVLGELGLSQNVSHMRNDFDDQLRKITDALNIPNEINRIAMTSMTGCYEVKETKGEYFPKIRKFSHQFYPFLVPKWIYAGCQNGQNKFIPSTDFIVWDTKTLEGYMLAVLTFSREAPILAFESSTGKKALGVILRPSLLKYGDYIFSSIKDYLNGNIQVTLVVCNHFKYPEGSIPTIVQNLANKYGMACVIGEDSEKNPDCYHRGESGNHVVALW